MNDKIQYKTDIEKAGMPSVSISNGITHIGTIFGVIKPPTDRKDFEEENGIIQIYQGEKLVAIVWNTEPYHEWLDRKNADTVGEIQMSG